MSKYNDAIKIIEERCGNDKEVIIGLATISLFPNAHANPRPAVRMVCTYYEEGAFYVSTSAKKK